MTGSPEKMPQWLVDSQTELLKSGWRRIRGFTLHDGTKMPDPPPGQHYVQDAYGRFKLERL